MLTLGNLEIFSRISLKSSDCNGRQTLERFIWEEQLVQPSHAWMVFLTNPSKFWNLQTVEESSIKHYGAQIFFWS